MRVGYRLSHSTVYVIFLNNGHVGDSLWLSDPTKIQQVTQHVAVIALNSSRGCK